MKKVTAHSAPDTSSVRNLVTSVTKLARHLEVTNNAIYKYIKLNKIPSDKLIKVANFYDVELGDIIHLAQSDIKDDTERVREKPRDTLPMLIRVLDGEISASEAAEKLGIHDRAVSSILGQWGEGLRKLYDTLEAVAAGEKTIAMAAEDLGITPIAMNSLRIKYGYRPERRRKEKVDRPIVKRRELKRKLALDAIAGRISLTTADDLPMSWRTIHREISDISPDYSLIKLAHWPKSLREAYAIEIERGEGSRLAISLWETCQEKGIELEKLPKPPLKAVSLRECTARQLLIQVLYGYYTLEEACEVRGAEPVILVTLFNRELLSLNLTWKAVSEAPVLFQFAVGEVLQGIENAGKTAREKRLETLKLKRAMKNGEI